MSVGHERRGSIDAPGVYVYATKKKSTGSRKGDIKKDGQSNIRVAVGAFFLSLFIACSGRLSVDQKKKENSEKKPTQTLAAPGACLLFFCRTTKKKDRQVKGEWGKQKKEWLGGALVWLQKKEDRGKGTFSCVCVLFYFFLMHSPLCHGTNPKGIALFGFYFLPAHTRKTRIYAQSRRCAHQRRREAKGWRAT